MKHLKHAYETLEKQVKTIAIHTQHLDKTLETYVLNIRNIQINTIATYV
jgi:hypothetical protein